ncbi:MAG: hypothetical protein IPJ65_03765 [Archangiaceae bacterium]|nr:hypothetical protein [Archangiaceae bacterium]
MAGPRPLDARHKIGREWLKREGAPPASVFSHDENRKVSAKAAAALKRFEHQVAKAAAYEGREEPPAAVKAPLVDALVSTAAAALRAQGVKVTVVPRAERREPSLTIACTGEHPLNREAASISTRWGGVVRYAPAELVGTAWQATYNPASNALNVDHGQILRPEVLGNAFKHERLHMESDFAIRQGKPWPGSGYLLGLDEGQLPQVVKGFDAYRTFQSLDELPAYLVSLEHVVGQALAAPSAEALQGVVAELRHDTVNLFDVALRAQGVLHRAAARAERGELEYWSDAKGRSIDLKVEEVAEHAHEVLLPEAAAGERQVDLASRRAAAGTAVALARLTQSVVDALPAEPAAARPLLAALREQLAEVLADREKGELALTFPEAVQRFNAALERG